MAEALVAIGLAANIVQFVCFSFTLVSKTRELHQSASGALHENVELSVITQDIKTLSSNIRSNTSSSVQLSEIAQRCEAIAEDLLGAIAKLQHKQHALGPGGAPTKWRSFRKALKCVWEKPHIDELRVRLEWLRDQVMLHLILHTNDSQAQSRDLLENWKEQGRQVGHEITAQIQALDIHVQATHTRVSELHGDPFWSRLEECLSRLSSTIHQVSRFHIIIASLRYDEMQIRQSAIRDAHQRTFAWMYSQHDLYATWPSRSTGFTQWLQSDSGIYWITGKPGSGKSTLMKHVYEHGDTERNLRVWCGDAPLVRACFYFWLPGQRMQKSLEGLLQTLLYHILHACPELAPVVCPGRWNDEPQSQFSGTHLPNPWSLAELKRSFASFRTRTTVATKFYFQVDGLDEYYGDSWEVIEILKNLSDAPNVKLCLSSRSWNCFDKSFGQNNPHVLRIHEYTRSDIELFVRENLESEGLCTDSEHTLFAGLVEEIRERAQGVFLWVRLVVRSLRNGIMNRDPISILQQRLQEISTDLEEFFEQIFGSVEEIYRRRMARTFIVAMQSPFRLNLIQYYFLDQENPEFNYDMPSKMWDDSETQLRAVQAEQQLNGRYKGLLEVVSTDDDIDAWTEVDFLHRTLRDFLATKRMREKLRSWASPQVNVSIAIGRAMISESKFTGTDSILHSFKQVVELANQGALETGDTAQCFELIDQTELETERLRPCHASCGLNCYILGFTFSLGQTEYLEYRMHRKGAKLDLNRILKHAIQCYLNADTTYQKYPPSGTHYGLPGQLEHSPTLYLPLPSLVKALFDFGADPNITVDDASSWTDFAGLSSMWIDGKHKEQYWAVLELFLETGVDVDIAAEHCIEIFKRHGAVSEESLRNTLRHFELLFTYGMSPNVLIQHTTLTKYFLRRLTWGSPHLLDTSRGIQLRLLREFFRNGADISMVYNDWTDNGWFRSVCGELERQNSTHLLGVRMIQYRLFLEHCLDPNTITYSGCTVWASFLHAVDLGIQEGTRKKSDRTIIREFILLSLQYGADPQIQEVQRIMSWMKLDNPSLSVDSLAGIERALQSEIEQRRQQA